MTDISRIVSQLDVLIAEHASLATRSKYDDLSDHPVEIRVLANRFQAAIDRITAPGSAYAKRADQHREQPAHMRLAELHGIAAALKEDLNAGWLESVVELVHADTFADYLEMAEELLDKKYKDAAAVIAGSSLEVHIRALCAKHGVATVDANGKPKKSDLMNADLKKASVYEGLQQKQVTSWLALRNSAAHGQYSDYDVTDVRQLINGIRAFMLKYPA